MPLFVRDLRYDARLFAREQKFWKLSTMKFCVLCIEKFTSWKKAYGVYRTPLQANGSARKRLSLGLALTQIDQEPPLINQLFYYLCKRVAYNLVIIKSFSRTQNWSPVTKVLTFYNLKLRSLWRSRHADSVLQKRGVHKLHVACLLTKFQIFSAIV